MKILKDCTWAKLFAGCNKHKDGILLFALLTATMALACIGPSVTPLRQTVLFSFAGILGLLLISPAATMLANAVKIIQTNRR